MGSANEERVEKSWEQIVLGLIELSKHCWFLPPQLYDNINKMIA